MICVKRRIHHMCQLAHIVATGFLQTNLKSETTGLRKSKLAAQIAKTSSTSMVRDF